MARKKRKPDEQPDEPAGAAPQPEPTPKPKKAKPKARPKRKAAAPEFDFREFERAMWLTLGREPPDDSPGSPRGRAGALLQDAFRASEPAKVVALAREALELWPDCADAYTLLAEHARGPKEALDLFTRGVEAGARDIGKAAFTRAAGHFWGVLPTRPYMRARLGQAQVLWVLGRRDEAVEHYRDLLKLNPNDNQGVRYTLAAALLETGRDADVAGLLKEYQEDSSACWAYSAALLAYRRDGDSKHAREMLDVAKRVNPFVPDYLAGNESLPTRLPDGIIRGEPSEAIDYAVGFLNGWRVTPGALDWLARSEIREKPAGKVKKAPKPKGPTPSAKSRLRKLPVVGEVWQADARQLPVWVTVDDKPSRPWIVVVANLDDGFILGQQVCEVTPTPESLWDDLAKVMKSPAEGAPRRPALIEVGTSDAWAAIAPEFGTVDVECVTTPTLVLIDGLLEQLIEHIAGRAPMPGLLEMPGVREGQVSSFYRAAASFYRAAPWQRVGGTETIKVSSERFQSGPWYAVVIGQMGMTLGVALYDDREALLRIRENDASDEENARETVALSVTYGRENEVNVADLDAANGLGWEVAAADAYPCPVRKERGMTMRPPLAWELQLLEAVLRLLPDFIDGHDRDDGAPYRREVGTGAGPLPLELAWVH